MSEASGTLVIRASDEINQKLSIKDGLVDAGAVGELMEYSGLSAVISKGMYYGVSESEFISGYVSFEIEEDSWLLISRPLLKRGKGIELYANVADGCGGAELFALNSKSESLHFHYELDGGDLCDQDGYDEEKYLEHIQKNRDSWLALVPALVLEAFPSLENHPKMML